MSLRNQAPSGFSRALQRDTSTFARRWPGKVLVAAVILAIPAALLVRSITRGSYIDDTWRAAAALPALAVVYLLSRRILVTVLVTVIIVTVTSVAIYPTVAHDRSGDASLLAHLDSTARDGMLAGFHDVSVAVVDLDSAQSTRMAGLGADSTTLMEVGSVTKAMTGLVIADSVERGELRLDVPVATYLPQLDGSPAGAATLQQLVTHTSGYAEFGPAAIGRALWSAPLGLNFFGTNLDEVLSDARLDSLATQGHYTYSSLGASVAGHAAAAAAGMSYADLMRTRLFDPVGMTDTVIQERRPLVPGGTSKSGLPVEPWALGAYAPGGGAVSNARDLAKLAAALLDGTAPGMSALDPTSPTSDAHTRVGGFWHVTTSDDGQTITWHDGEMGGYTTYFGLDRANRTAVIVLSDVANRATDALGIALFPTHR